ncbi:MAG TPA: glycogen/starch/alpha-glucan phosphorylase [Bacilli bacterium]|jgi:starch phosphorylase|nr:glycogen/starch/alpha-glucan phosphorylase [Bacilli bacterium]HOD60533.1 glycogen/starch/alpha-glucan phosphorylase [Bacilli bacterium]HOH61763.1 glycogen/starch/alpha-glucan phosphorylase [Bacilli bacterium]HOR17306.1 glycogen/starch/alpha-glucan phosphorylase [Bacilli bacterium]HPL54964.1 glycogen/starch/alpha-glucan phosphorylase [Bacilli bacterium]
MTEYMRKLSIKDSIEEALTMLFGVQAADANLDQLYKASATVVNNILRRKRKVFNSKVKETKGKRVYYLSMEFLMGRSLKNSIYNLGLVEEFKEAIKNYGYTLDDLYEKEPDAGLGNGGLGRLGACYLDALASQDYPAMGFSLRYEYGLFKQKIVDGWQTELPDVWLPGGEVWLIMREDKILTVKFNGYVEEKNVAGKIVYDYKNYQEVEAVPYDMMVSGANSNAISVLRLWRSRNIRNFDLHSFTQGDYLQAMRDYNDADLITKILYPSDDHYEGKALRIKQQYFLVSASIQNIIKDHIRYYGDVRTLPKYVAIHINDTHPALCIPELMRILMDEYDISFDDSWDIVKKTVAYTNHTVLAEALEKWSEELIQKIIPRIYIIIKQINKRFIDEVKCEGLDEDCYKELAIIGNNQVRMANLSVIASHTVNGVSALHSEIIKNTVFNGFYRLTPEKFTNVTNGIAYRRWLCQSNPNLVELLDEKIGFDYHKDALKLVDLLKYYDDEEVLNRLEKIKYQNKCEFAKYLYKKTGITVDPKTRFDVQVKRLHEYKRQLLNALKIVALFIDLEDNPHLEMVPQTFIFGGKAAPTYYIAKDIIKLICCISSEIAKRPAMQEKLNVVFIEDYNVTTAEILIPASEVSEQISLAGKEASGTGNMKFMINGALTFGTLDGANVEITESVGEENIFLFGMRTEEVKELWAKGYQAQNLYNTNPRLRRVLDRLDLGFNNQSFSNIKGYLLSNYPIADPYMCLADFDDYMRVHYLMDETYKNRKKWNKMSLVNIAKAGIFSADRSIREYAERIWNIKVIK